jgi:hypothetical protein
VSPESRLGGGERAVHPVGVTCRNSVARAIDEIVHLAGELRIGRIAREPGRGLVGRFDE